MAYDHISFGGRERPIAFTSAAMAALQRRFRFTNGSTWMLGDVLGVDLVAGSNTGFNIEARFSLLAAALECGARKVYPAGRIHGWYDEAVRDGTLSQVLWAAVACAFESGAVTGRVVTDFDAKSGALKPVFFAATPAELQAAVDAYFADEPGSEPGTGDSAGASASASATPDSPSSSCAAADAT